MLGSNAQLYLQDIKIIRIKSKTKINKSSFSPRRSEGKVCCGPPESGFYTGGGPLM